MKWRNLSRKAKLTVLGCVLLFLIAGPGCPDLNTGDGSCRGPACYSAEGHNP